ncbi:MAG: hypothetical protein PHC53_03830 [Patescibacteria group bacterium]|nr:hypothetical protein [Patescibacteria group bacterium]
MRNALFMLFVGLAVLLLALPALATDPPDAAPPAAETCADACGKVYNVCIDGNAPDLKAKCGALAECKDVSAEAFADYNQWFAACIKSVTHHCHPACVPPATTTTPATGGNQAQPETKTPQPGGGNTTQTKRDRPSSYRDNCVAAQGIYRKTETTDENGILVTREECLKLQDAFDRIAKIEARLAVLEGNPPAPGTKAPPGVQQDYRTLEQIRQGIDKMGNEAEKLRIATEKAIARFGTMYSDLNQRMGKVETSVSNLGGRVTVVESRLDQQAPNGATTLVNYGAARLPCSLAAYGSVHAKQIYNYTIGSVGGEAACSLFGSSDGSANFYFAAGIGVGNKYAQGSHLYEWHMEPGGMFRLGDHVKFLIGPRFQRHNVYSFESGAISWLGVNSGLRFLFSRDPWTPYIQAELGLGASHFSHPIIEGQQFTRFDALVGIKLGFEFDPFNTAKPVKPAEPAKQTASRRSVTRF